MKKKSKEMAASFLIMSVLSAGYIFFVNSGIWDVHAGTPVDLNGMDTAAYQVDGVSLNKEGDYIVSSRAAGFQSDIAVAVTFDAEGSQIRNVEVISQAETEGLGTRVTEAAFLEQFAGILAPVRLSGTEAAVVSPGTGAVSASTGEQEPEIPADNRSNPDDYNPGDQSPETVAVRNLYRAGLLTSAVSQQPLKTAYADASPEVQAAYRLAEAGLADGMGPESQAGMSAESIAEDKLHEAGLTSGQAKPAAQTDTPPKADAAAAGVSEVDAVSGATISSQAVVQAVDQAYFFIQENILKE